MPAIRKRDAQPLRLLLLAVVVLVHVCALSGQSARSIVASSSADVALLQPTSVAYDTTGNLYFAESRNHVIRRVDASGALTTIAGSAVQGFAGDGGVALSAQLDSPRGVALDSSGDLYIADTRNHRVRRIDAQTRIITTVAGTGTAGFSGDAAPATAAQLALPVALALDANKHLYIADSGNNRIRSVDLTSGLISTVAGTGAQGYSGDGGAATSAAFDNPTGLASDSFGNLFIADSGNCRVREVSATSHIVSTVAGGGSSGVRLLHPEGLSLDSNGGLLIADPAGNRVYLLKISSGQVTIIAGQGTQAFSGDQGLATLAMLDSPRGVANGPAGELAIADTGNERIRLLLPAGTGTTEDTTATIATLAGANARLPASLVLTGAATQLYGSTTVNAALTASGAQLQTAQLTFYDLTASSTQPLTQATLTGGTSGVSLATLSAGPHTLMATYSGNATYSAAQSAIFVLQVSPLPVTVSFTVTNFLYGTAPPMPLGAIVGVLPSDAAAVAISFSGLPSGTAPVGSYTVQAQLSGAAAPNYTLSSSVTSIRVSQAPVNTTLTSTGAVIQVNVASTTSGTPSGAVTLLTAAGTQLSSAPLSMNGSVSLAESGMAPGMYSLTAIYSGDGNFLSGRSVPVIVSVGSSAGTTPLSNDFSIAPTGSSSVTLVAGSTATYNFTFTSASGALSSPVVLSVTGAPSLATTKLNPALIPPGSLQSTFALTVTTPGASASLTPTMKSPHIRWALAGLGPLLLLGLFRSRRLPSLLSIVALVTLGTCGIVGCGERTVGNGSTSPAAATKFYNLVVSGVATNADGTTTQRSATVTLGVQ